MIAGEPDQGLRGFANEKKVWIGGLPAGPTSIENNKKLKEHMAQEPTVRVRVATVGC